MALEGFNKIQSKLERFCAYQERSPFEVKKKLGELSESPKLINGVFQELLEGGYVDEKRFVECYVQSKLSQKKWGKLKIKSGLIQHKIPAELIRQSLADIDLDFYQENLRLLIIKKNSQLKKDLAPYETKIKVLRYLSSKGYTSEDWNSLDLDNLLSS